MRLICVIVCSALLASPLPAAAQEPSPNIPPQRLVISERAINDGLAAGRAMAAVPPGDDSLANGALAGAIVGAIAAGAFGTYICVVLKEEGDPPCWRSVLPVAAVGAGIGVLAGIGIDAMAMRAPRLVIEGTRGGPRWTSSPRR